MRPYANGIFFPRNHLRDDEIRTEHLMLAIIRQGDGVALRVLENLGVDPSDIRSQILLMLNKDINQDQKKQKEKAADYNYSNPKLTMDDLVKAGLVDVLAECFDEEHIAKDLLIRISFPRKIQPNFHKYHNPLGFWQRVFERIESGVLEHRFSKCFLHITMRNI